MTVSAATTGGMGVVVSPGLSRQRQQRGGVEQLVLPRQCYKTILTMAHSIPIAGHLGKQKTAGCILQQFYWPGVHNDVQELHRMPKAGQAESGQGTTGSTPRDPGTFHANNHGYRGTASRDNRYVLVVCDYATRYPEAMAMRSVEAEQVAEELVTLFSRVGVPEEILTDQGTNVTPQLLQELYHMLHVRHIRTSRTTHRQMASSSWSNSTRP